MPDGTPDAFRDHIKTDRRFYASIGNAAVSAVDIRDIAAVAVIALTEAGHKIIQAIQFSIAFNISATLLLG
jgi:uncharacterized protein YbjT (DUF2867 family)